MIWLGEISYWVAVDIISISMIGIVNTGTESTPGYKQYPSKNKIELFIMLSKTSYFFFYGRPKIIEW